MNDKRIFSGWWLLMVALVLLTSAIFATCNFMSKPLQVLDKVTEPQHIISSYEDFQSIYDTCKDLCQKIENIKSSKVENMTGFSKDERILALENTLSRWVNEYNAKSKMITRNAWKSPSLPYSLTFNTICNEN